MDNTPPGNTAQHLIARGQALEAAGDSAGALDLYDLAARLEPDNAKAALNRGNALSVLGRLPEAEAAYRRAAQLGDGAPAQLNLGNLFLRAGYPGEAAEAYAEALRLRPGWEAAGFGQLCVLHRSKSPALLPAIDAFLKQHPDHRDARRMQLDVLSTAAPEQVLAAIDPAHCTDPRLLRLRATAATSICDHASAIADLTLALQLDSADPQSLCALAFARMRHPGEEGPRALLPLIARALPPSNAATPPLRNVAPYRVGYLSGDYRAHPAANFLMPLLLGHRRERFTPVALANLEQGDSITAQLRAAAAEWIDLGFLNDQAAEARLHEARLDVIVDFSGWTAGNRLPLLARRIAPVQLTAIGVYLTTGVPTIDFRICDAASDPPGLTEAQHSETLLRTDGPQACYHELRAIPATPLQPARVNGHFTFGFFNNSVKITREMVAHWIRVLQRVPTARLKILGVQHEASRQWLGARFGETGVAARVSILGRIDAADYDRMLGTVDLALDSHPYNGGTTTIECLLAGVPVLTHSGPWPFSRSARVFLEPLGLADDWAVDSAEAFVERAVQVATGPLDTLESLRADLPTRVRTSVLMDRAGYIERWEAVLLQAIELRRSALQR